MMRALLVVFALLFVTRAARAEDSHAYTALSEVHACQPLDGGGTLVGTSGGLALVGNDRLPPRVWTVLDGLPETRVQRALRRRSLDVGGNGEGLFRTGGSPEKP